MSANPSRKRRDAVVMEGRRLQAVEGFKSGHALAAIARRLGVSRQAVWKWREAYRRRGRSALQRRPRSGRPPKLSCRQREQLLQSLAQGADAHGFPTAVWTTPRIASVIWRRFRVRYHPDHIGRLLHRWGLSWQKATGRAVERDEQAIARWVSHTWPRLKKKPALDAR
jgi:transposase